MLLPTATRPADRRARFDISVAYAKGGELDRWPAGKRRPRGNRGAPLPTGLPPRRPVSCGENEQSAGVAKLTEAEVGEPRCWRVRYGLILPSRLFVRLTVNPQMTGLVQPICCRLLPGACPSYDQSSRNNSAPIPGPSSTSWERPRNSSASSRRRTNTQPSRVRSTNIGFRQMRGAGWSRIGGGIERGFPVNRPSALEPIGFYCSSQRLQLCDRVIGLWPLPPRSLATLL